jgi:hypothetical protein
VYLLREALKEMAVAGNGNEGTRTSVDKTYCLGQGKRKSTFGIGQKIK